TRSGACTTWLATSRNGSALTPPRRSEAVRGDRTTRAICARGTAGTRGRSPPTRPPGSAAPPRSARRALEQVDDARRDGGHIGDEEDAHAADEQEGHRLAVEQ